MLRRFLLGISLALTLQTSHAEDNILDAENAIKNGAPLSEFAQFASHPLYPYLQYRYYRAHLDSIPTATLVDFLKAHPHAPFSTWLADAIYPQWLLMGQQQAILDSYSPDFTDRDSECLWRQASLALGKKAQAYHDIAPLWLSTKTRDDSCTPLFSQMLAENAIAQNLIAERFQKAMQAGKISLAIDLQRDLQGTAATAASTWIAIRQNQLPASAALSISDAKWRSMAVADALYQLARRQPDDAALLAINAAQANAFTHDKAAAGRGLSRVAARLAQTDDPQATAIFELIPKGEHDKNAVYDMIAYWLRHQYWQQISDVLLQTLDSKELENPEYQYWIAKSFDFKGNGKRAREHYEKAAQHRDFFGFLAAEKLSLPYAFNDHSIQEDPSIYPKIANLPGAYRLKIFMHLGKKAMAVAELRAITRHFDAKEINQAALFASRNGLPVHAILLLAKNQNWDALTIRFPVEYQDEVMTLAQQLGISPAAIYAIIRKESVFQPEIRSPVGAVGLMQLMPRTAAHVARQYSIPYNSRYQLTNPDMNLDLGSHYLRDKISQYGHLAYAAAAYNAGESRATRWLSEHPGLSIDEWIAQIPFYETRDYAKRILEYDKVYEYRLGQKITPFSAARISPW